MNKGRIGTTPKVQAIEKRLEGIIPMLDTDDIRDPIDAMQKMLMAALSLLGIINDAMTTIEEYELKEKKESVH